MKSLAILVVTLAMAYAQGSVNFVENSNQQAVDPAFYRPSKPNVATNYNPENFQNIDPGFSVPSNPNYNPNQEGQYIKPGTGPSNVDYSSNNGPKRYDNPYLRGGR